MGRYTFLLILLLGGLSITGVVWFSGTRAVLPSAPDLSQEHKLASDVQVRDMRVMAQVGPTVSWWVSAAQADFSQAQQYTTMRQIEARFVGDSTDIWYVTAPRGRIDTLTGDMIVEGSVRLSQLDGYTIETERLYWDTAKSTLYTDAVIRMQGASLSVTATGLRSQVDQHRLTLAHDVRASFQLREPAKELR